MTDSTIIVYSIRVMLHACCNDLADRIGDSVRVRSNDCHPRPAAPDESELWHKFMAFQGHSRSVILGSLERKSQRHPRAAAGH